MEHILDTFELGYNPLHPVVCMDEKLYQLLGETRDRLPIRKGSNQKIDSEYTRKGTCSIFVFTEPLSGIRHVTVRERRTAIDCAEEIKYLADVRYPEARRLIKGLEIHYTPKHCSWLNIAEIELNVMTRQCLRRRIDDISKLRSELSSWEVERNDKISTIN